MAPSYSDGPRIEEIDSDEEHDAKQLDTRNSYQKANDLPAKETDTRPWEELPFTEQVEKLREFAWKVQSRHHKPGCVLPEDFKKQAFRETGKVVSYCLDCLKYVGEADFKERAPGMRKRMQEILTEIERLEQESKDHRATLAFKPDAESGSYSIQSKASCSGNKGDGRAPGGKDEKLLGDDETAAGASTSSSSSTGPSTKMPAELAESKKCNGITATGVKQYLKGNVLKLPKLGLGDTDMGSVLEVCKDSSYIQTLDLSHNEIADAGMQQLVAFLASPDNLPSLKTVRIDGNAEMTELGRCMVTGLRMLRKKVEFVATEEEAAKFCAAVACAVEEPGEGKSTANSAGAGVENKSASDHSEDRSGVDEEQGRKASAEKSVEKEVEVVEKPVESKDELDDLD
ncbi:unnamed protein product [Amoebophrya sp. A120]|nr:unnamed protein product [Amoebophrya sp. A120]|eukprot:GSA120T00019286001.1